MIEGGSQRSQGWAWRVRRPALRAFVDDAAVDDGYDRTQLPDIVVGHGFRIEVIRAEHDEVPQFPGLDRAERGFFFQEPAVLGGVQPERLHPRQLLSGV